MKYFVMITLFWFITIVVSFFGGVKFATPYTPVEVITPPTGQEVLAELNTYRLSQGLEPFELSDRLCDNIVERWHNYKNNNSHEGWDEFAAREYPGGFTANELLVAGESAKIMVDQWVSSPSHDLAIKSNSKACVYSYDGLSVALLSN